MPEGAQGFTYIATAPGRFLAQLRALAARNKVKILSDPHILVRNNEEAIMNVGSSIPIKETTGTGDDVKESITYQDVGIILTVTHRLILQEMSSWRFGRKSVMWSGTIRRYSAASFTTRERRHP
jgi:type II secretory pathway component GspD/PulD (secretin)